MTHEERVGLAYEIAQRILDKYGDQIQAIAVYGSTAKNEDAAHSDLEMWVATSEEFPKVGDVLTVYKGITIEISYAPVSKLLNVATQVDASWPISAESLRSYALMFDRGNFSNRIQ